MSTIEQLKGHSPHRSFNQTAKLNQVTFTTNTYQSLTSTPRPSYPHETPSPYWGNLPAYQIAVCPFCSTKYHSLAARSQVLDKKFAHVDFSKQDGYHPGYLYDDSSLIDSQPLAGDLMYWVKCKKLMWLDLDDPELALIPSPIKKIPYEGLEGLGWGWRYIQRPKPKYRWQRRNWTPDGDLM